MKKSPTDKLQSKRYQCSVRTAQVLGVSIDRAQTLLSQPRRQSLRINPLKANDTIIDQLHKIGWEGEAYDWIENCYTIENGLEQIRDSPLVTNGSVYIQNAASWLPVLALDPEPKETILDVCAAPGGKTSHIAAVTKNMADITANDNSRPRLAKLQSNLQRLGVTSVFFSLFDARMIAVKLEGNSYDKILIDAPCSGEGMLNFASDKEMRTWSTAHIKRLQQLQKRIISQAWKLLRPGGTLVYSTCTIAPEENEAVIDYLLRSQHDASIVPITLYLQNRISPVLEWNGRMFSSSITGSLRLAPSESIEAFFVCKLIKAESSHAISGLSEQE